MLENIESYRDNLVLRTTLTSRDRRAERFINRVGYCSALRMPDVLALNLYRGMWLENAYMPRNVQKDPEARLTWNKG